jgi:hypothetical protein
VDACGAGRDEGGHGPRDDQRGCGKLGYVQKEVPVVRGPYREAVL